jgi:acetate CoA/acetoacetate CoA-transferase alpha subunit
MLPKDTTVESAVREYVRAGQTIMVGGFGRGGVPFTTLKYIADRAGEYGDLTLIKNDASEPGIGIDMLLKTGQVKKLIATHIGLNPDFIDRMNRGEIECELIPQGIFAEKIRAGGAGIPAILTDIGVGTEVEQGKQTFELHGKTLLVEECLRGDVALICADKADKAGNAWWRGSNRNMCVVMGTACKRVIVEAYEIVEIGDLPPEDIHLPGVFVDAVVPAGPLPHVGGQVGQTQPEA